MNDIFNCALILLIVFVVFCGIIGILMKIHDESYSEILKAKNSIKPDAEQVKKSFDAWQSYYNAQQNHYLSLERSIKKESKKRRYKKSRKVANRKTYVQTRRNK